MKKIPKRFSIFLTASFMALLMSTIITGVLSLITLGLTMEALHAWITKTPVAFLVAWPTATLVLPIVRKFVERITE